MILPRAPEKYDRTDQDELRRALDLAVTKIETLPTGWVQATGTAMRATFDTTTVTLPVLAQVVKALIDDIVLRAKS